MFPDCLYLGSFGEVFIGRYQGTKVAIKKVSASSIHVDDSKAIDEFKSEAKVMKDLPPHPNVVLFRGITLPPDPLCIVLDFCKEGSLYSLLRSAATISDKQKIKFSKQIARGMVRWLALCSMIIHRMTCDIHLIIIMTLFVLINLLCLFFYLHEL